MPADPSATVLISAIDEALDMLRDFTRDADGVATSEPLPSLLEQCEGAVAGIAPPQPIRSIHHFACTGGTVMSKALFALPNAVVLSEIDPLSRVLLSASGPLPFAPTDLIFWLRQSVRPVRDETIVSSFLAGLAAAKTGLERDGQYLILRDHAHSQFCRSEVDHTDRPTLREMISDRFDLRSIVTMRHPLDSFLSLLKNDWVRFSPATLEEYARRYLAFLDRHEGVPVVLYEDFVADPRGVLERMCELLELKYSPVAIDLIDAIRLSGDSGRRDGPISPRTRRQVPPEMEQQRRESPNYITLCARFGYDP